MDFGKVFELVGRFFIDYCGTPVTLFGFKFTVGTLFLWCGLAVLIIGWIKGVSS